MSEDEVATPMSTKSPGFERIATGEHARIDKDARAPFLAHVASTYPRASFCALFWVNLFWIILTLVLAGAGLDPINLDSVGEVGLAVPDGLYQRRANAYRSGKDKANLGIGGSGKCARQTAADPVSLVLMKDEFLKDSKGNALTQRGLRLLKSREDRIVNEPGWSERCNLVYTSEYLEGCDFAPGLQAPTAVGSGLYNVSDASGCFVPYSPTYFFAKYDDPEFDDIPGTVAAIAEFGGADWLAFQGLLHKDFRLGNLKSKILISSVFAGTPRKSVGDYVNAAIEARIKTGANFKYYTDRRQRNEREHLGNWVTRKLGTWLENKFLKDEQGGFTTLYYFSGYEPLDDQVNVDLALVIVSLIIVFCFMWFYTRSLFVTSCGMLSILTSFFGANLLYRYCWPTEDGFGYNYFTLFCALSLFIITGIGADDIFVYWDTWNGSSPLDYKTRAHRLVHVWSHAAGAMAVTSLTTVVSFLSNLSSPFVGVRTFGVYAALLVFVNYCCVTTYFPCVVLMYDTVFKDMDYWWQPLWDRLMATAWCQRGIILRTRKVETAEETTVLPDTTENNEGQHEGLPLFFKNKFAPFIIKFAKAVIAVHVAIFAIFLYFACTVETTPFKASELLDETTNFRQWNAVMEDWIPKSAGPKFVHVVFGLKPRDPLSLHQPREERFVPGVSGDPHWDTGFDLDSEKAQLELYNTAEEFAYNARRGLKIDNSEGINPQLTGSTTGSLENTADGGSSSSVADPYGVQSLMHAFASWENVTRVLASNSVPGVGDPLVKQGQLEVRADSESSCRACFATFTANVTNAAETAVRLDATSALTEGCACVGYWPVPSEICLYETRDVSDATQYHCIINEDRVANELGEWFVAGETAVDRNWWDSYIFALPTSDGGYDRIALYDIQVQTTIRSSDDYFKPGLKMTKKWDDWMEDYNDSEDNVLQAMVYVDGSEGWELSSLIVSSAVTSLLTSLFLAWLVLSYSTGNLITSTLAVMTIGMIVTIVLGFLNMVGWGLGPLEAILIVLVIGFSVDYTVHLADSYMGSEGLDRESKVLDALVHTGSSVLSGAVSTVGASIPMLFAEIIYFFKFGIFIFITILLSLLFSLCFFAALLSVVGPVGKTGSLSTLYAGCVKDVAKSIDELEEKDRLIKEKQASKTEAV